MTGPRRVAVVPSTPALLPAYAGVDDPFPALRRAALGAAAWLLADASGPVEVLASPQRRDNVARGVDEPVGRRVGRTLLGDGAEVRMLVPGRPPTASALLVVANGSATRSEKAPGHLDQRSFAFDDTIAASLRDGRPSRLAALDAALAEQLWCFDSPVWCHLGELDPRPEDPVVVDYDDDPFGVQYWVVRWTCGS